LDTPAGDIDSPASEESGGALLIAKVLVVLAPRRHHNHIYYMGILYTWTQDSFQPLTKLSGERAWLAQFYRRMQSLLDGYR
jgi:hypothetical protein